MIQYNTTTAIQHTSNYNCFIMSMTMIQTNNYLTNNQMNNQIIIQRKFREKDLNQALHIACVITNKNENLQYQHKMLRHEMCQKGSEDDVHEFDKEWNGFTHKSVRKIGRLMESQQILYKSLCDLYMKMMKIDASFCLEMFDQILQKSADQTVHDMVKSAKITLLKLKHF